MSWGGGIKEGQGDYVIGHSLWQRRESKKKLSRRDHSFSEVEEYEMGLRLFLLFQHIQAIHDLSHFAERLKLASIQCNGCDRRAIRRMPTFSSLCAEYLKSGLDCYADCLKVMSVRQTSRKLFPKPVLNGPKTFSQRK